MLVNKVGRIIHGDSPPQDGAMAYTGDTRRKEEQMAMKKRTTIVIDEKDAESVKKLAERFGVPQTEVFRAGVKLVLKMKVSEQTALFKKK